MIALAKALGVVPGFVWALICAALLAMTGVSMTAAKVRVAAAQAEATSAKVALAQEREYAARELAEQTNLLRIAESDLRDAYEVQENKDREHEKVVADLRTDLLRRVPPGAPARLRDPGATACPAASKNAETATAPQPGGEDVAETGRELSPELAGFLIEQAAAADEINIAYASCREDAITLREKLKELNR